MEHLGQFGQERLVRFDFLTGCPTPHFAYIQAAGTFAGAAARDLIVIRAGIPATTGELGYSNDGYSGHC